MPVYMIEDSLFFSDPHAQADFHVQKLLFHRATMQAYIERLKREGYEAHYKEWTGITIDRWLPEIFKIPPSTIHLAEPADHLLEKRIRRFANTHNVTLEIYPSPAFIRQRGELEDYFGTRKQRFMATFYKTQRKHLDILMDSKGEPRGGQWSFDEDNRKKLPRGHRCPAEPSANTDRQVIEARAHVTEKFPNAPGGSDAFWYAVDHASAQARLQEFLDTRFALFGDYEDAIAADETVLYHSVLTPYLNSGLLTPQQIVDAALKKAESQNIPLNSLEGFIRQIIGWREFMHGMYIMHGTEERTRNFWHFTHPMPQSFYDGTTGIEPIDTTIRRVLDTAYCHHIERLMVLGNFMVLCRIHPDAVYRWFMELFIDAYDWVMVPNVYGMSQFADGGIFTTKPYISSSNYIRKMSNYGKGDWCAIWDGLFWAFIKDHEDFFRNQPRLAMMTRQLDRMKAETLASHQSTATRFLDQIHGT